MKLNKFGKLYISHARNMTSGEISVITFISQVCSGNLKKYQEKPSVPPKFCRIPTAKFMKRCDMSRSEVFEAVSRLIKNGMVCKKKIRGKAFYFPADNYSGEYYGMVQEEHMMELTKNEKLVYGYLSACQGNNESCDPKISTIAHFTGKSKQIVSKTITSLVRKDVIKRVVNPQKSSTYFVKRFDKDTIKNLVVGNGESPENVLGQSPENVLGQGGESPENVHHYINNLLKEDNNLVCNNPASGDIHTNFFEGILKEGKEKSGIDNISNLGKKEILRHVVLGTENKHEHSTSLGYTPAKNYVSLENKVKDLDDVRLKKIIDTFSPAEMGHLKTEGVSEFEFARVKFSIEAKNPGITVRPLQVKKINKSEIKSLQDFADKYIDSGDRELKYMSGDALDFIAFGFTVSLKKRRLLDILLGDIEKMNNVIHFDFNTKKGSIAEKDGKKVW